MRRLFALLLAFIMLLAMTACGKEEEGTPTGESAGATTNTTESTNDTTEGTHGSTQGTTESTTGGETTETTEPPTTTPPTTTPPTTTSPTTTPSTTETPASLPSSNSSLEQLKSLVNGISGIWYLEGYSDVYIDITYEPNNNIYSSYMYISSHSFSIKDNGVSLDGSYVLNDYKVYPHIQCPEQTQWTTGKMYWLNRWENLLAEDNIEIKNDCIYMDTYKFVRARGTKNQHSEYGILDDGMEHDYESKVIEATPTTYGYTLFTCKVCGYSYEDNHFNWDGPTITEPPTTEPQPVRVSGVQINKATLSLNVGDTQQLTANVSPSNADNKSVTWSSSNSSVAQVSSTGKITAKGAGSATITVTTVDGNYTAKCTVTVAAPPATEPPTTEPVSDVLIISNTQTISNQTIDTDVYITSTGVATLNNVTVNGNIYCYGQLKCSGCTANNVYAYAYGSMMSCGAFDGTHGKVSGGISCNKMTILDNALDYAFSKWGKK